MNMPPEVQREALRAFIAKLRKESQPPDGVELLTDRPSCPGWKLTGEPGADFYTLGALAEGALAARRSLRVAECLLASLDGGVSPHPDVIYDLLGMEKKAEPAHRLEEIRATEEALSEERTSIYRASFRAEDPEHVLPDCTPRVAQVLAALDDDGRPEERLPSPFFTYPITVDGILHKEARFLKPWKPSDRQPTPWVSIRPCDEKTYKKDPDPDCEDCRGTGEAPVSGGTQPCSCMFTWLGVYLGDLPTRYSVRFSKGILEVGPSMHNPAIWIPEKHTLVFGMASWWGPVKSEKHLRTIGASDIHGLFYVRAASDLFGVAPNVGAPDEVARTCCIRVREKGTVETWWVDQLEDNLTTAVAAAIAGFLDLDKADELLVQDGDLLVVGTVTYVVRDADYGVLLPVNASVIAVADQVLPGGHALEMKSAWDLAAALRPAWREGDEILLAAVLTEGKERGWPEGWLDDLGLLLACDGTGEYLYRHLHGRDVEPVNPEMDALAAQAGLPHWKCVSRTSNEWWRRVDGIEKYAAPSETIWDVLRATDSAKATLWEDTP